MRWRRGTTGVPPVDAHAMIIGAMKCSTSSLYDYLCQHPAVCPCRVKEPEFFSRKQLHGLSASLESYGELWRFNSKVHRLALEASTGYTKYPYEECVPETIYASGLKPLFIYVVRDPFARIESHYNFIRNSTSYWVPDSLTNKHMVELSMYHMQLERYACLFGRQRILVLRMEDLQQRLPEMRHRVFDFLQLEETTTLPEQLPRLNDSARQSKLERRLRRRGLGPILDAPPRAVRGKLLQLMGRAQPVGRRRFTPTERAEVRRLLAHDMRQLSKDYGIDVADWGF